MSNTTFLPKYDARCNSVSYGRLTRHLKPRSGRERWAGGGRQSCSRADCNLMYNFGCFAVRFSVALLTCMSLLFINYITNLQIAAWRGSPLRRPSPTVKLLSAKIETTRILSSHQTHDGKQPTLAQLEERETVMDKIILRSPVRARQVGFRFCPYLARLDTYLSG